MLFNTQRGYGWVAITLHWAIAMLIVFQWTLGKVMKNLTDQRLSFDLIQWHKSFGLLILTLVMLRLGWRLVNPRPAMPAGMGALETSAAYWAHRALYALMLFVPLSGWAVVSTSLLEIPTFAFYLVVVPDLPMARSDAAEAFWTSVHNVLGWALLGLFAIHVLAALRHQCLLRDEVLLRMLKPPAAPPTK